MRRPWTMDGNQNKILELLAPDLQTKSYAKDQRESGEERQKRERGERDGGGGASRRLETDTQSQAEAEAGQHVQVSEHKMPPPLCH